MTDPDKPDHARAWRYIEKLLDEEDDERLQREEERIEKMSEEELLAELRAEGHDPANDPSVEEILQRAEIRAGLRAKEEATFEGAGAGTGRRRPLTGSPGKAPAGGESTQTAAAAPIAKPPAAVRPRPVWQRSAVWLGAAAAVAVLVFFVKRPGPECPHQVAAGGRGGEARTGDRAVQGGGVGGVRAEAERGAGAGSGGGGGAAGEVGSGGD